MCINLEGIFGLSALTSGISKQEVIIIKMVLSITIFFFLFVWLKMNI